MFIFGCIKEPVFSTPQRASTSPTARRMELAWPTSRSAPCNVSETDPKGRRVGCGHGLRPENPTTFLGYLFQHYTSEDPKQIASNHAGSS